MNQQATIGSSFVARSTVRQPFPAEVQVLFTEKSAPPFITLIPSGQNDNMRPQGIYTGDATVSFFCDESVSARCTEDFRALVESGHEPFLDYAHLGEKYKAALVRDVYYIPTQGVCAAVDWFPWAEKEILSLNCCSFSPEFFVSDDAMLEFTGLGENIGGLLHRSMEPGLPRLRGSINPVTRLEDVVFRASHFRRLLDEHQRVRAGDVTAADAENELKRRMPSSHSAFRRYNELVRQFGPNFYFQTK